MKTRVASGCLLLVLALSVVAAPPEKERELTDEEKKEVARRSQELDRQLNAGQFEDAVKTAQDIADYRAGRQGDSHWEVIDARLQVKTWQRPKQQCEDVVRGMKVAFEGRRLQQRLQFRESEAKLREALAIFRDVLGEGHPDTAMSFNNVAVCLNDQGKLAEALPFYQKALAIQQKVLGEQHPATALGCNNVAACLHGLGKLAEALPLYQKALAIRQAVLGEQHADTAASYNNVAACLDAQGKHAEALVLFRKALAIREKVLGEEHAETARSCNSMARCLGNLARHDEALTLYRKALAIQRKVLGEEHPDTAISCNNVGLSLSDRGRHAEALPLLQKALAIHRKVFGEQHPTTATNYNNVAACLNDQGKHAEALPLYQKALAIQLKVFGEQHPDVALCYNNVAACLDAQARHAEALPLFQKALAIKQKVFGEEHPDVALSCNNVAACLNTQGKQGEALPLYERALAIREKTLGKEHPDTAASYNGLAVCLHAQGKHAEALSLYQKALAIREKVLGEHHLETAASCNNVAVCLHEMGKPAEALFLFQKARGIFEKILGEQHPHSALSCSNVAGCLYAQGKPDEALPIFQTALARYQKILGERHPATARTHVNVASCFFNQGKLREAVGHYEAALVGHEFARLKAADTGFDRALFRAENLSPRAALAVCMVRLDKPVQAWEYAESDLARGLLDDLLPTSEAASDEDRLARLRGLDQALIPLLVREKLRDEETKRRDELARERDDLLAELARLAGRRSRARLLPLERIQKQLPADAAIVFWLDLGDRHLGCILRREGPPAWVKLPGSGKDDAWIAADDTLPGRALAALSDGTSTLDARKALLAQLHRQRLAPLEPHLKEVRHLLVVPSGVMSAVPVEALTDRYLVSYAPSASVFARRMDQHRPVEASSLLVLADPAFTRAAPVPPPAPAHGLLVKAVTPGSLAARVGVLPGDVLLEYDGKKLTAGDDLKPAAGEERVPIKLWREGKTLQGRIHAGNLGVVVDRKPIAEALADWRKQESSLLTLSRGDDWQALPGTRLEARTLAGLLPATTLLGSDASERKLGELASSGKLKDYRLLHLATHGQASEAQPRATALILSQDALPTPAEAAALVLAGKKPPEGRLTVATILDQWELDADLVVLSACQTGLGKRTSGEGMLGFTQALLQKGAHSVVLSRWKVDDAATALLMERFYQNLLGKRDGLKESMKRAEGLAEAKSWLRNLSRAEAEKRLAALVDGVPRGERGSIKAALPTRKPDAPKDDRPFAHPYYWAAFVLIGDPF